MMSAIDGIKKIERQTMADLVYSDLCDLLMAGQASPGEKFTLRTLAEALGTSAMPVRGAVNRLVAEQALEVLPNRSVRVPVMTRARFSEVRRIRVCLEGMAAAAAARSPSGEQLAEINVHHRAFSSAGRKETPDVRALIRANKELHFSVYRAAAMPTLLQIIEGLWLQVGPIISIEARAAKHRLSELAAFECHQRLVDALKRGDGEAARLAVVDDITAAGDFILAHGNLPD